MGISTTLIFLALFVASRSEIDNCIDESLTVLTIPYCTKCKDGYFPDIDLDGKLNSGGGQGLKCSKCNPLCATCISITQCLTCKDGSAPAEVYFLGLDIHQPQCHPKWVYKLSLFAVLCLLTLLPIAIVWCCFCGYRSEIQAKIFIGNGSFMTENYEGNQNQ